MEACKHQDATRHGFSAQGKQRWVCKGCGVSFVDMDRIAGNNRMGKDREVLLFEMLARGLTIRAIRRAFIAAGIKAPSHWAIYRRMPKLTPAIQDERKVGKRGCCDFCGVRIKGDREFDRRTRRTRHKFCTQVCYRAFWREVRGKRRCKRCGVRRDDIPLATKELSNRMCPRCYAADRKRKAQRAANAAQLAKLGDALDAKLAEAGG